MVVVRGEQLLGSLCPREREKETTAEEAVPSTEVSLLRLRFPGIFPSRPGEGVEGFIDGGEKRVIESEGRA